MDNKDIRILYAEDEPVIARMMIRKIKSMGFDQVEHVEDGDSLLTNYTSNPFQYDIIISDGKMPGISGIAVLETLRASGHKIPFILFSSMSDLQTRVEKAGRVFIEKEVWPETIQKLQDTIHSLVSTKSNKLRPETPPVPPA